MNTNGFDLLEEHSSTAWAFQTLFGRERVFGTISKFRVSSPELLPLSSRPCVAIPLSAGVQSRFLLGAASPEKHVVSHTAPTQGSITRLSAQEHLRMHCSEQVLALSPPHSEIIFS